MFLSCIVLSLNRQGSSHAMEWTVPCLTSPLASCPLPLAFPRLLLPLQCKLLHAYADLPTPALLFTPSALSLNTSLLKHQMSAAKLSEDSQASAPSHMLEDDNAQSPLDDPGNAESSLDDPGDLRDADGCCECRASIKDHTAGRRCCSRCWRHGGHRRILQE